MAAEPIRCARATRGLGRLSLDAPVEDRLSRPCYIKMISPLLLWEDGRFGIHLGRHFCVMFGRSSGERK